jgi:hypothetical protein
MKAILENAACDAATIDKPFYAHYHVQDYVLDDVV